MDKILITCPHCGEQFKISFDNSGYPTVFLLEENQISVSELSDKYGIDLGVVEGGENHDEC